MSTVKRAKVPNKLPSFGSQYYPPELTDKQVAQRYLKDENKPINILNSKLQSPETYTITNGAGVVHLFNNDIRVNNNRGLHEAAKFSECSQLPLVGLYVYCIEDLYRHSVGKFQLRFKLDSIKVLQQNLNQLNIPLVILTVDKKIDYYDIIKKFLVDHDYRCLTTNINYEVDELRDLIRLHNLLKDDISFYAFHDTCIVAPGELKSGKGTQYSVFSPWNKAWNKLVNSTKIPGYPKPKKQDFEMKNSKSLETKIPTIPNDLDLNEIQSQNYQRLYKPGEQAAYKALSSYLTDEKLKLYDENRNKINLDNSSHLSCYISIGALSCRTILLEILKTNLMNGVDKGNIGAVQWVRQVAWRDFYKHVISNWPHLCMFRPFHLEYSSVNWEYNKDHFDAWCQGLTGFPIVDACMRQLNQTGYMSNRGRMIVASFLSKHIMIDWRYGERYFMELLVDGDFASNNGGWGFSSSTGVDPQPYFRIFNPYLQSERFDSKGEFIKQWVPELKHLDEKSIHNPYENHHQSSINDYPMPIVDHKFARERALERYNEARH